MDRDFTQAAEEAILNEMALDDTYLTDIFSYESVSSVINADTTYYFNVIVNSRTDLYDFLNTTNKSISQRFYEVRELDAYYANTYVSFDMSRLDEFKTRMDAILDCIKAPTTGNSLINAKYHLSGNSDTNLYNSIFGDGWNYASLVSNCGFENIAANSASAYDHYFNELVTINEDGSLSYDMEAILSALSKPASEIVGAEYDAMALAYLYMSEEEMEKFIQGCTNKVEDVKYGFNLGISVGFLNEDYSKWELDADKYGNIVIRLEGISSQNLESIIACDGMYRETGESKYLDAANYFEEVRKENLQKIILFDSLSAIEYFHGDYQGNCPTINISYVPYEEGSEIHSIVLTFNEFRNVGSVYSSVFSNRGSSTIIVSPVLDGAEWDYLELENVSIGLKNRFTYSITDELASFASSEITDYAVEHFAEQFAKDITKNTIPFVGDLVFEGIDITISYLENQEDADYISAVMDDLQDSNVYHTFGCYVETVSYSTGDCKQENIIALEGRNTQRRVDAFNEICKDYNIDVNDVLNKPNNIADIILELNHDERNRILQLLESVGEGN